MFRSRAVSKSNCVAVDRRADENFEPGETLKPYPDSRAPPKEFQEIKRVEKADNCAIL